MSGPAHVLRPAALHGNDLLGVGRFLLGGWSSSSLQTETLPLSLVLLLQVDVVEAAGLPRDALRVLHRLGRGLPWWTRAGGGAGAVRQAGVKTSVAPGVLREESWEYC